MKKVLSRLALFGVAAMTLCACGTRGSLEEVGYKNWLKYSIPYYESLKRGNKFTEVACEYVYVNDPCITNKEMDEDTVILYGEIAYNVIYLIDFDLSGIPYTVVISYLNGSYKQASDEDADWLYYGAHDLVESGTLNGRVGVLK